jgi:hypothetical protein
MNNKRPEIEDQRNFAQRIVGLLLLDVCSQCHKHSFTAASYGNEGHCSACGYTTPLLIPQDEE